MAEKRAFRIRIKQGKEIRYDNVVMFEHEQDARRWLELQVKELGLTSPSFTRVEEVEKTEEQENIVDDENMMTELTQELTERKSSPKRAARRQAREERRKRKGQMK